MAVAAFGTASATSGAAPVRAEIPKVPPPPPVDPATLRDAIEARHRLPRAASRTPMRVAAGGSAIVIVAALLALGRDAIALPVLRRRTTADASRAADAAPLRRRRPRSKLRRRRLPRRRRRRSRRQSLGRRPRADTPPPSAGHAHRRQRAVPTAAASRPSAEARRPTPRGARARGRARPRPGRRRRYTAWTSRTCALLVVVGTKAKSSRGVLNFGGGQVAVVGGAERRDARVDPVHGRLVRATYTQGARIRSGAPVLAAPPANVDLPGGLFSPARHWLTLQSRSSFLIVRLNDSSWRQVLRDRHGPNRPRGRASGTRPVARAGHAPASLRRAGCSEDAPLEAGRDARRPSAVVATSCSPTRACRATTRRCACVDAECRLSGRRQPLRHVSRRRAGSRRRSRVKLGATIKLGEVVARARAARRRDRICSPRIMRSRRSWHDPAADHGRDRPAARSATAT